MDTPVALIIFNRPDTTAEVFAAIAAAAPRRLFVIADGPRPGRPDGLARCAAARAVTEQITWECEVTRFYSEVNRGCGRGPAYGLGQLFAQVDEAIILEDDCVPHPSFFPFCSELLARYRDDERVMMISGNNFLLGKRQLRHSYYFNHHAGMWGWATWRRAWRHHQIAIDDWLQMRDGSWLQDVLIEPATTAYWSNIFDRIYAQSGTQDVWDAQWYYAMWSEHGLAISPRANLVSNIGFRDDATHTRGKGLLGHLPATGVDFPLVHPPHVVRDREAELLTLRHCLPQIFPYEPRNPLARRLPRPLRDGLIAAYRRLRQAVAATRS